MPAPASFVHNVRHALAHIYDPDVLRSHPLLPLLGLNERANPQAALRETLLSAIETLKPALTVPVTSRAWRVYKVLQVRYVQQMDQEHTANQLGVGVRHVRREQHAAVDALADLLYQKLAPQPAPSLSAEPETGRNLDSELAWLRESGQSESAPLSDALLAALHLVTPLAQQRSVALSELTDPALPVVAMHPLALRQALVSAITFAIRRVPGGHVSFACESRSDRIRFTITASSGDAALHTASADETASLEAARAIVRMVNGILEISEEGANLAVNFTLAAASHIDVLLVDDNPDFAQLFARYVAGTRYRLHRASAAGLFDALAASQPRIVVLDVMMPESDGWEVLGRLRQHPLSSNISIIICTILPERDLALALGASDFLPKPVTRQELIAALDRALATERPESH